MLIVLTGIDGSGKTTAARDLVLASRQTGEGALFLGNYAGRRTMALISASLGVRLPLRLADFVETVVRTCNVLTSHYRARKFQGLVVMDRHFHCQLALRSMHGLPRGRFLPFLIKALPPPDVVIYLEIDPREAHGRVIARGTDTERLEDLESLHGAYQSLPEFARIISVPATGTPAEVLARLQAAIAVVRVNAGEGSAAGVRAEASSHSSFTGKEYRRYSRTSKNDGS
ncbi:dTMP kinase [Arthrobacter sp. MP_M7]|nr:dTMP kinase [Arthrobacter sp. MP_M4]MEC5202133.1 dTMP kinase [Arthrobacter sp. MP_M7]